MNNVISKVWTNLCLWFDTDAVKHAEDHQNNAAEKLNIIRCIPFILMHLGCIAVFWVGWSPVALWVAGTFYFIRMFAITGFYHRYFSHRSFKTNRFWQFIFAVIGCTAVQRGPLWWAAHHRHHHQYSDTEPDTHSPVVKGFWWSHMGWFTCDKNFATRYERVKDFSKFPELRWLNRYDMVVPTLTGAFMVLLGMFLGHFYPELGTSGSQMFVWGFLISTVLLFHGTFTINSLSHVFGSRRYETKDNSRNNPWLALLTLGEGWHNNHHRWPACARQGFFWWEIDITYYILKVMSWLGIVWDLKPVPAKLLEPQHGK